MKNFHWNALRLLIVVVTISALLLSLFTCTASTKVDNTPVQAVDLNRYLGVWYEIARYDHRFERGLTHCSARYALNEDGRISVVNSGIKDGHWETSEGKAKLTQTPGLLRVSFFGPFYSDYRILMLASDYSYALVGGSSSKYLWILSRTPEIPPAVRDTILREAQRRGYDTNSLIWVDH